MSEQNRGDYLLDYYRRMQESLPLWSDEYAEYEQLIRELMESYKDE